MSKRIRCAPCSTKAGRDVMLPVEKFHAKTIAKGHYLCIECQREKSRLDYARIKRLKNEREEMSRLIKLTFRADLFWKGPIGKSIARSKIEGLDFSKGDQE